MLKNWFIFYPFPQTCLLQLILTEIYSDGFRRTFHDTHPLSDFQDTDNIYAIETPPETPPASRQDQRTSSRSMLVVVTNIRTTGAQIER